MSPRNPKTFFCCLHHSQGHKTHSLQKKSTYLIPKQFSASTFGTKCNGHSEILLATLGCNTHSISSSVSACLYAFFINIVRIKPFKVKKIYSKGWRCWGISKNKCVKNGHGQKIQTILKNCEIGIHEIIKCWMCPTLKYLRSFQAVNL